MDNYSNLLMDECPPDLRSPEDESKPPIKKHLTKGVSTSFGFRKRPTTAPSTITSNNPTAARRLANTTADSVDNNGNTGLHIISNDMAPLTSNAVPSGRSTPNRLPPPKKEAQATTKISRFGFREPNANRLNRVADINTNPPIRIEYSNNNISTNTKEREKIESEIKAKVEMQQRQMVTTDTNRNRPITRYTLQTNQLPKPQPIKFLESKMAKTLANNNKKQNERTSGYESSSFTEDSGVDSHCSDNIRQLNKSPMSGRLRYNKLAKRRALETVISGNIYDVRNLEEETSHSQPLPSLPTLPTLMNTFSNNYQRPNTGFVRDRAIEYQRNVIDKKENRNERMRRNSLTSSEASSHYEDEKPYKRNEKIAKFIKQKPSSPPEPSSSDDQMWSSHAGEAMAEEFSSVCMTSSDECKDMILTNETSVESLISAKAHNRLSLVDPQFAAIAAANVSATLIEDEPSPVDSIVCSYSEHNESKSNFENGKLINKSSTSNSKDVNDKNTVSSPGSPTNASNSLSLSDDRDDFLIDDEIADQPALLFDDTLTNSNQASEATPTVVDSTPKPKRRIINAYEGSPLSLHNRKLLRGRTASLDTLSPCDSIASDDCMMDYDLSSGVEDANDRAGTDGHYSFDDVQVRTVDLKVNDLMRDWSTILATYDMSSETPKRLSLRSSRVLKSRDDTPSSSVPESPRLDVIKKTFISQSPLRLSSRSSIANGYESDDSSVVRLDRSQHCAMQQDVMGIKTMLLKLKRVLHESETRNSLAENGFFSGFGSDCDKDPEEQEVGEEIDNLRRQVVFLMGQLEDTERIAQNLREDMVKLTIKYQSSQSAPASVSTTVTTAQTSTCNAATQTERIRPMSAGPALFQGGTNDLSPGSLVSFRIGQVECADVLLGVCILCAVNILCLLNIMYSCSALCNYDSFMDFF